MSLFPQVESSRARWVLAAILLVAVCLRLWNVSGDLPELIHTDEGKLIRASLRLFESDSSVAEVLAEETPPGYPPGIIFLFAPVHAMTGAGGLALGRYQDSSELRDAAIFHPDEFYLGVRVFVALLGVASVLVTFKIGETLSTTSAGLWAAAALALAPVHIVYSGRALVDVPLTLLTLLTVYALLVALNTDTERPLRWAVLGACCAGATIGLKYNMVALLPVAVVSLWLVVRRRPELGSKWRWMAVGMGALAVGFTIACPLPLVSPGGFLESSSSMVRELLGFPVHEGPKTFGTGKVGERAVPWAGWWGAPVQYLADERAPRTEPTWLLDGMGATLYPVSLIALGWYVLSRRRAYWIIGGVVAITAFVHAIMPYHAVRMLLPIVPLLVAVFGVFADSVVNWVPRDSKRVIMVGLFAAVIGPTLVSAVQWKLMSLRPSTQLAVKQWFESNVPDGAVVGSEPYGPPLLDQNRPRLTEHLIKGFYRRSYRLRDITARQSSLGPNLPVVPGPQELVKDHQIEWIVLDSYMRTRFYSPAAMRTHPKRVQQRREFYAWVERNCELALHVVPAETGMQGPEIWVYHCP